MLGSPSVVDPTSEHLSGRFNARSRARWHPLDYLLGTVRGQFMGLVVVAVILNVLGALIWRSTGGNDTYDDSWEHSFWFAWGMFFDPGTEMAFAADEPVNLKVTAVSFSILGFSFNLLFLGLIVDLVRNMLEHFRRKRNRIIANGHTLILGWTQKTLFVIDAIFRSSGGLGATTNIVILAEEDVFRMRQELELHFPNRGFGKHIQLREGSPFECDELTRVSAYAASEIVILASDDPPRLADLKTMRTVISLAAMPKQPSCPVTAEVRVHESHKAVKSMFQGADGVFARDAVRHVMCLCALEPLLGPLGDIYDSLISSGESAEIYLESLEDLGVAPGSTIGEAQAVIDHGIIIGVRPKDKRSELAPPPSQNLSDTDELLVLSGSVAEISYRSWDRLHRSMNKFLALPRTNHSPSNMPVHEELQKSSADIAPSPKNVVIIIGWPKDIENVLTAIDGYIRCGSRVVILASLEEKDRKQDVNKEFIFEVEHKVGNTTSIDALKELPFEAALAIMVLADDSFDADRRLQDAASLETVVTIDGILRDRCKDTGKPKVVCEILTAETERALRSDNALRRAAKFFHTEMLETALFTIASKQRPVFYCLKLMLQTRKDYGDIVIVPATTYYDRRENEPVTWKDCFARVRGTDDVLIGVVGGDARSKGLHWDFTNPGPTVSMSSHLIVVTKRKEVLVPEEREKMAQRTATVVSTPSSPASHK